MVNNDEKRGRKSSVTLGIKFSDFKIKLKESKIKDCFISKVKPLTSGAYVPISQKYKDKEVFIIVLED